MGQSEDGSLIGIKSTIKFNLTLNEKYQKMFYCQQLTSLYNIIANTRQSAGLPACRHKPITQKFMPPYSRGRFYAPALIVVVACPLIVAINRLRRGQAPALQGWS